MMIVASSSVFVNGLPPQCGLASEGREKLRFRFFGFGMEKLTTYNAAGAAISRVPATSVSPAIELTDAMGGHGGFSGGCARALDQRAEVHLVGRRVVEVLVQTSCVVKREVSGQGHPCFAARGVG